MLVLTRKRNESIMIGDQIEVKIMSVKGDQVRIGISAPAEIPVYRQEIYQAISAENQAASRLNLDFLKKFK